MTPHLEKLQEMLSIASKLRNKIIWVVGNSCTGKTKLLKQLKELSEDFQYVNINKSLSEKLINEVCENQKFTVGAYLAEILDPITKEVCILDNIEILFAQKLRLSPVDALKKIAIQAKLVVAWPGTFENNMLIYGDRNHPDYCEYQIDSAPLLNLNNTNNQG